MISKIPRISVIILNFNGLDDTIKCLDSLKKTKYANFEVIIVDNGSSKNEAIILGIKYKNFIKTYRLHNNLGFTGGNNWALAKAKGKYLVLLNNDTIVEPNWLEPLVKLLENNKKIAVVQPKIKMMFKKSYFDYAGAAGGYIDKYGFPFTRGRIFNTQEKDISQYDGVWPIFWASGSACMIRKSIIKRVGGLFSENLFNYMEEIDFCWRVWRAGYKVMFTSESVVYHKVAASAGKNVIKKRFWEHRNNLYILIRNLDRKNLLKILPLRIFLELIAYPYYIISRQRPFIKSLLSAHLDFLRNGFYIRQTRDRIQINNHFPIYPGSIILDHYIKKIKTFKMLRWSPIGNINYLAFDTSKNTGSSVIFKQANDFIKKGFSVKIYFLFGKSQNWFNLKAETVNFINSYFKFIPDVLISTFWPTAYLSLIIRAKRKYYFSQDWGPSMHNFFIFQNLARLSYKLPLINIVHGKFLEKKIRELGQKRVQKIRYCVLNEKFKMSQKEKYKKINKTLKYNRIKILSVISWYANVKGPDLLVEAIKKLKQNNNDFTFTLVSRENKAYSKLFDKFISDPSTDQLVNLYRNHDILLIPSRTEGMPITGLEAMASGCIVISTSNGGINEYAKHNQNAVILNNIEDLWKKDIINKLTTKKRKKLIKNGFKTVNDYWEDKIIYDLENIIKN